MSKEEKLADQLDADVNKAEDAATKKKKELPAMVAPTVGLPIEIRKMVATYCRDSGDSFAKISVKMWIEKLVTEKLITREVADKIDLSVKRGGGISKEVVIAKDKEIEALQAELAKLKKEKTQ